MLLLGEYRVPLTPTDHANFLFVIYFLFSFK